MKIVSVIPIKLNNERLPGKNLKLICGRPLISYILKAVNDTSEIDESYVYCSDEEIKKYLFGNVTFLKRPRYLDESTSNFSQIFAEFSNAIDADIYVYAHATAPFISSKTISDCINMVVSGSYDSAFTAECIQDFLWCGGKPLNFNTDDLPRSQDLPVYYRETSGIYVFNKAVFNNHCRRIGEKPFIKAVSLPESIDINYQIDFDLAEYFFSNDRGDF